MRIILATLVASVLLHASSVVAEGMQVRAAVSAACNSVFDIRSAEALEALFGKPTRDEVKSELDQHSGQYEVESHHATFPTAEAWFAFAEAMGPALQWERFSLTKSGSRIAPQVWIGESLSEASSTLGSPDRTSGDRAYYDCDETRDLVFVLNSNTIVAIEWIGYLD